MASLTQWLAKAISGTIDPRQAKRVQALADVIQRHLDTQKQNFSLRAVLASTPYDPEDLPLASEAVLRRVMERAWADEKFTPEERRSIEWLAKKLDVAPSRIVDINLETAKELFGRILAGAMEDGVLDGHEEERLSKIARSIGRTPAQLGAKFFRQDGAMFLQAAFSRMVEKDRIMSADWPVLFLTASRLGLRREDVLDAIRPQAQKFAELFLAEAKFDGLLSAQEKAALGWIVAKWDLPREFNAYVEQETEKLETLTRIAEGVLPTIPAPPSIDLRAGEVVHFAGPAEWLLETPAGRRPGVLALTNGRLLFAADAESFELAYDEVRSHDRGRNFIAVQTGDAKRTLIFADPALPYAVLRGAVARAKGTGVVEATAPHPPREVLWGVWARCDGKCSDCSATDYLEFDYITPVERGGANDSENPRILCRRCLSAKSDQV